jgi:hypothetical protein
MSLIGFVDFFIDKTIACTIVNDNNVYYLITAQIIENYNYLYTKETNYVTSSTKQDYTETIVVNDDFAMGAVMPMSHSALSRLQAANNAKTVKGNRNLYSVFTLLK